MLPQPTDRLPLGATPLRVSPLCLGMVGDPNTVLAAFDAGVNFFFLTADMHWPLYGTLRRGLELLLARGVRDQIVVAGVSYVAQPEFSAAPLDELVQAVPGLDYLDVCVVGGARGADLLPRVANANAHRDRAFLGIQSTGVSFHDRRTARIALNAGLQDIGFVRYNTVHTGAEEDLFPHIGPRRSLCYNFKSTFGHLSEESEYAALGVGPEFPRPPATDHYRFALQRPEVDGLLLSLRDPVEVGALVAALAQGPLPPDELKFLRDLGDLAAGRATLG